MNLIKFRNSFNSSKTSCLVDCDNSLMFFLCLQLVLKFQCQTFTSEILKYCSNTAISGSNSLDFKGYSIITMRSNLNFFHNVFSSLKYVIRLNENTEQLLELFVETLKLNLISNSNIKNFNYRVRHNLTTFSNHFRYFLFLYTFLKNFIEKMDISEIGPTKLFEQHELLRIHIEKKEIFFLNMFYKFRTYTNRNFSKIQKNFYQEKRKENILFVLDLQSVKFFKINSILNITIINSILTKKLASISFTFYFYQRRKIVNEKSGTIVRNLFRFLKKETFLFSIELLTKIFKKIDQHERLEILKNIILSIHTNVSFCKHKFDFLKEFLQLFDNINPFPARDYFSKKSEITIGKTFLLKILERLYLKENYTLIDFSDKKKNFKKISNEFLKDLILSNSVRRCAALVWHFFAFKYLKNALEISWKMQLTRRYTDFFNLNLNQSMKFNYKILNFSKKLYKKHILHLSEKCLKGIFYKKSSNFFGLVEKFFSNYYTSSGLNSPLILKHYNRILALGNLFLLSILRIKKLIKNHNNFEKYPYSLKAQLKINNLFKIFYRKIEILLKNLNNSINFIEIC